MGAVFFYLAVLVMVSCGSVVAQTELFPLEKLRPGMKGQTYTVLQGTKIEPLETEILGVAKGYLGPGLDMIIARLIDPKTALCGAVHGMSGSPLYIEGKLVGALSHRIMSFEKEGQCGFTPIKDMLVVDQRPWVSPVNPTSPFAAMTLSSAISRQSSIQAENLSLPFSVSGISSQSMNRLIEKCGMKDRGFLAAAGGGTALDKQSHELGPEGFLPGSALAAILIDGDINASGTGTLTWREGKRVLGFGHPMMGIGNSSWPMGTAEIITVISSYLTPFKMSNQGRIIGTITQDRASAIAGLVGPIPKMAPYRVERTHNGKELKVLTGTLFPDPALAPMLVGAVLWAPLEKSNEIGTEFFLHVEGKISFEGLPDLNLNGDYSGEDDELMIAALDLLQPVSLVLRQEWSRPRITEVNLKMMTSEKQQVWEIERAEVERLKFESGESVRLKVTLRERYGERKQEDFVLKLPENLKAGQVDLVVAGGLELDRSGLYRGLSRINDTKSLIEKLNHKRSRCRLYVQTLTRASGEIIDQYELPSLPASVQTVMEASQRSDGAITGLSERIWQEESHEWSGLVTGRERVKIEVK